MPASSPASSIGLLQCAGGTTIKKLIPGDEPGMILLVSSQLQRRRVR